MSRLVKIVDNKYVQIEEYRNPNICFNTNEYDDFENYCTLRETFEPFELFYENQELKKQLEYLRSREYYNQLKFENKMLQDIVDNGKVSKEDREFIDCTHRNTELLEQQQGFIKYLEEEKDRLAREVSNIYEDGLGKTRFVKEDIFNEVDRNLQKYKEIIGLSDEKK